MSVILKNKNSLLERPLSLETKPLVFVSMEPSKSCKENLDCPEPYKCMAGKCGRLAEVGRCKSSGDVSQGGQMAEIARSV